MTYPKSVLFTNTSNINGVILSLESSFYSFWSLSKNNQALQKENAQLRNVAKDNYYQIQRPIYKFKDTVFEQSFSYIPASVINSTIARRNNYFLINVGAVQHIEKGWGVISQKGVIGIIFMVGDRFSLVKSVLTSNINIDVIIGKQSIPGILKWNGKNAKIGSVYGISTDIKINPWSDVRTRGSTGIFPKGIHIGKVKYKQQMENQSLWDIDVLFDENFKTVTNVYVIKSKIKQEIHNLELNIPSDNIE